MATINFDIPTQRDRLLSEVTNNYCVKNVVIPGEIVARLADARTCFNDEGADFILDNFDTYYSVLHHAGALRKDVVFKAYVDLHKAVKKLDDSITFLLDDQDSLNDELKAKMVTILKMLLYIYTEFVLHLEENKRKNSTVVASKGRKKQPQNEEFNVDKLKVLGAISTIMGKNISLFWDPPILDHNLVALIAELCFSFIQNPAVKQETEVKTEIFGLFGMLIKQYDYGNIFVARLVQSIRMYEHVVQCVPDGVKLLVEQFNCRALVHSFVKAATEWQIDENFQDNMGTRCCSTFLTELAVILPDLMIPEMVYLTQYLSYELPPLRISVLNVITQVILKVFTKHDLSEEEKESRDEFLEDLLEHIRDRDALVRVRVIQNLIKLQKENAIPLDYQNHVLERVIEHLLDKVANVRKAALSCITTFLQHNPFGANLQLKNSEKQLSQKVELLNRMEAAYKDAKEAKLKELESEWAKIQNDVKAAIEQCLENPDKDEDEEDEESEAQPQVDMDEIVESIRTDLKEEKYAQAFRSCQLLKGQIKEWKNMKRVSKDKEVEVYLAILRSFYLNIAKFTDELRTGVGTTAEDVEKMQSLEKIITYLESTASFLKIIDGAIPTIKKMLFTKTISDMHVAIEFFVTAFQFQIDNASEGVLGMLKLMQYNEPERKEAVVEAFKTIYLTTNSNNMTEHTTTILKRLIALKKEITYDQYDDFVSIVAEWTSKGVLDNSVIDKCWQYYTQREPVSDEDSLAAADLLRMAAIGRQTIITKNIKVVTTVAFSDKFKDNMLFLAESCRLLTQAGSDKVDIQGKNPPFTIKHVDPMFHSLVAILVENFFKRVPYYAEAMRAGLDFIVRVCSKPMEVCEKIIKQIHEKLESSEKSRLLMIRLCDLLGYTAVRVLAYFDSTVYRELKRRNFLRESLKENNKNNVNRKSSNKSHASMNVSESANANESVLMGAEAEDTDAEFILNVLENDVVLTSGILSHYVSFLTAICKRPDLYNDSLLQRFASIALIRYMLVSSKLCRQHITLLFTMIEKTTFPEVKCMILVHCSDLLTRFPNIVEPWSSHIYERLKDPLLEVRTTAFFTLSSLILRDMIRAHSHISKMAACLIDKEAKVCSMAKEFFGRLAQKENNLANDIPDIFSHLVKADDISEDNLKYIMKYLFDIVDSSKRNVSLVDRFCCKYLPNEDLRLNRNITYCLSLISYNDKALKKLHEKFPMYKHHVHDADIYSTFKQILAKCSKVKVGKTDLMPIVTDIENCIASVFQIDEDGQPAKAPPIISKSARKPRAKSQKKKSAKKQTRSSESDSSNDSSPRSKKSRRKKKQNRQIDSDSD